MPASWSTYTFSVSIRSVSGLDFLALSPLVPEGECCISCGSGVTGVRGAEPRALGHSNQGGRREWEEWKGIHNSARPSDAFTSMGAKVLCET